MLSFPLPESKEKNQLWRVVWWLVVGFWLLVFGFWLLVLGG